MISIIREEAVRIIYAYINERLFIVENDLFDYGFRRKCYARWAAYEIANEITNSLEEPFFIVLHFMYLMDNLSKIRKHSDAEFIFVTARNTAEEILKLF